MVKSNSQKKYTKAYNRAMKQTAGRVMTDLLATKLAEWQKTEIDRLLSGAEKTKNTYIVETKSGYRVGRITVVESDDRWQIRNVSTLEVADFYSKPRALLYAILLFHNKSTLAKELKDIDRRIVKYTNDIEFYRYTIKVSSKKKDYARAEGTWYRLDDAVYRLKLAKEQLEKTVNSAKYIKLWDEQP